MKPSVRLIGIFVLIVLSIFFVGCSASGTRPVSVSVTPASSTIDQGETVTASATVSNDSKNAGVTWSLAGLGTLTSQTGTFVAYTAPSPVTTAFTATITATSVSDTSKTAAISIHVNPNPTITTTSVQAATAGTNYSATVSMSGGTSPFTWSISSGTLPPGLSMGSSTSSSVTVSGMPTGGNSTFTVSVKDSATPAVTSSQQLTITVNPPAALTITTPSLGAGAVGTAYNQTLAATGGVPPYAWAIASGSLPAGLTLNTATGAITGTPTGPQTGTISFSVSVTDSQTPTHATQSANLGISVTAPTLSVSTSSLSAGTLGTVYSQTLAATGGITPYSWSISTGSLPQGMSLNSATGAITGTPTGSTTGAINFTVKVTDAETPTAQTATKALSVTISASPLSVTTSSLPTGVDSSAYTATLQATGGVLAYTWAVTTGSLPAGLTLNTSTGAITGTPTGAGSTFTVTVTDAETPTPQTANKQLTITVNPQLAVTTTSLAAGTVGTSYNQTLAVTGGITPYSWTVTTGNLPAGLSLNASTGAITGKPTGPQTGTVSFTVTVTDSESPTKTATANLSILISAPPLSVTTSSLPGGTLGTAYSQTLTATGGITPYTWSISLGSLPQGLSLNSSTGAITGTPTGSTTGPIGFTVKVTDSETPTAQSATAALSISIAAAPLSVTTSSLPSGVDGSSYSATLQAAGGVSPYTWAVTTGNIPAGLTLNASTGAITGTPTGSSSTFTVTVTDSETPTAATATKQLTITMSPQLSVTTTSLAAGTVGTSYNQTLAATGGITPYSWAVTSGSLPAGLTLNASTGAITGKPTGPQTGAINFTVTVTDSESPTKTASANLSITVSAPTLSVTTTSLAGGSLGQSYSATLAATGGITPYSWSISAGSLPVGLSLNTGTGAITGTPTGNVTGAVNFTVSVADAETPTPQTATKSLSITISTTTLSVTTTSLPTGVVSSAYSATLQATGGITPYSWGITTGALPTGLTLNTSTGAITGTPTSSGTTFTVTVTDAETPTPQTANKQLTITLNPRLSVTTTSLAGGTVGTSYNQTLAATGGITPYSWAVTSGGLPAGLTLAPSTGAITGKPTGPKTGAINFTVTVTDTESPAKTASAILSITITAPTLSITTTSLSAGVLNNSYSATVAATGGVTPYIWSLSSGSLPIGLTLNTSTGQISGTPTASGTSNFTVQVTDSEAPTAQTSAKGLSITIDNSAPLTITTPAGPLTPGVANVQYSGATLQASGGLQPYTWSILSGSLPAGLSLSNNSNNGVISGTPTATGTSTFTAKVVDSSSPSNSQTASFSITINAGLTITTSSLPNGAVGIGYSGTVNASGGIQPYSWTVTSGSLPPGLTLNGTNGQITGTPTTTGPYTFTITVTDQEPVSVSNSYTVTIGAQAAAYTVSGNVTYPGATTGQVYLQLNNTSCNGCNGNNLGTSIPEATLQAGGAFTIHGVPPGTYTLQAYMDNLGYGAENASNPIGSTTNITVSTAGVSGVAIALANPSTVSLTGTTPSWKSGNGSGAFSGGAFVDFQTITNNNGIEMPSSYTVEWSTSSSFGTVAGSKTFAATGNNNPWLVSGLTNGTTYYFRAQGVAGSSTSNWSAASPAFTIDAPPSGAGIYAVSGTVTFNATAKGPLYVGFYNQSTGTVYADVVGSKTSPPASPASYSVNVPAGSNYFFFAFLDQNNSGMFTGPGQISNTNNNGASAITISGVTTNEDLTLSTANATAVIVTQSSTQNSNTSYTLGFNVNSLVKLPVSVELATGPSGIVIPADIANGGFYGNSGEFSYWTSTNGITPQVGDTYTLNVTYSDGTTQILTVEVSTVLDAYATLLAPAQGAVGVSVTPNFSWTDPANAGNYAYQFSLCCDNNGTIWQIPGNNSNSNGFSSSITSITWNVDPTNSGDLPNEASLSGSTNYSWSITTTDANGNSAQVQASFETVETPLTVTTTSLPGGVLTQSYSQNVNAGGGVPPYSWSITSGSLPPGLNYGSNNNSMNINGTPTGVGTYTFTATVTDSASTQASQSLSITISNASPLQINTNNLPEASEVTTYSATLSANGGVPSYTWSISTGSLPAGITLNTSTGVLSGTPTVTGTYNFTLAVTDSTATQATMSESILVITCANNAALTGNWAFLMEGWKLSSSVQSAIAGSFVSNGSGLITSGSVDTNDQNKGPQNGTFTGTYCIASNNLGLMTLNPSAPYTGSSTYSIALNSTQSSPTSGRIIEYDNNNHVQSGPLRKQTTSAFSTSKITGDYAFQLIGADGGGTRMGIVGEFNSNGAGTLSGMADGDDGGTTYSEVTVSASDLAVLSSTTGRGTVTLNFIGQGSLNVVFYVVNANALLLMEDDATGNPLLNGSVAQQTGGGSFTDSSLDGNMIVGTQALDSGCSTAGGDITGGILAANGSGTVTENFDENDCGTLSTDTGSSTYTVASNGRVPLTGGGGHPPVLYLITQNEGFIIGTDSSVAYGQFYPQTGSSFTASSINGTFTGGSDFPEDLNADSELDSVTSNGTGTFTNIISLNNDQGEPQEQNNSGATYTVSSNGRTVVTAQSSQVGIIYIINSDSLLFIPAGTGNNSDQNPALEWFVQ